MRALTIQSLRCGTATTDDGQPMLCLDSATQRVDQGKQVTRPALLTRRPNANSARHLMDGDRDMGVSAATPTRSPSTALTGVFTVISG